MPDADIKKLILADRKAVGRKLQLPVKTYPKTEFSPLSPKRDSWPESIKATFTYINPSRAKDEVMRRPSEVGEMSMGSHAALIFTCCMLVCDCASVTVSTFLSGIRHECVTNSL